MPVYQYTCTQCGHDLEARQSFSDDALTDCPACGVGAALRKQFNSVGVVFKGSGFYRNDARNADSTDSASNGSKDKSNDTGDKKSETKSESTSQSSGSGESKSDKPAKSGGESAKPAKAKETASSSSSS